MENFNKYKFSTDGYQPYCKSCATKHRKELEQARKNAPPKPKACQLCKKKTTKLHVDHIHGTGEFRGWLCGTCNKGLGHFDDNIHNLARAIQYLAYPNNFNS